MRMSIDEYKSLITKKKRHKYNAVAKVIDGIRFDSTAEANYYEELKLRVAANDLLYFLRQVPIHLPSGEKMRVDFMLVYPNQQIQYVDVKGHETRHWAAKKNRVEKFYPFVIDIVRSTHGKKYRRRSKRAA